MRANVNNFCLFQGRILSALCVCVCVCVSVCVSVCLFVFFARSCCQFPSEKNVNKSCLFQDPERVCKDKFHRNLVFVYCKAGLQCCLRVSVKNDEFALN